MTNPAHPRSSKCQQKGTFFTRLRPAVEFPSCLNIKPISINSLDGDHFSTKVALQMLNNASGGLVPQLCCRRLDVNF